MTTNVTEYSNIMKNYGIIDKVRESDWKMGVNSNLTKTIIKKDGNWSEDIPLWESQIGIYGDTMACVTYSALDCIETIVEHQLKYYGLFNQYRDNNKDLNFSDRYIAKLSGTTKDGNYFTKVAQAIRDYGLVPEYMWDFPHRQRTPVFGWDEYYKEIPQELFDKGDDLLKYLEFKYELIPINNIDIKEQLKYGPLQISYKTSSPKEDDIYQKIDPYWCGNHAIMLYNVKDNGVIDGLDHYKRDGHGHVKFAPDYLFGNWALQYYIIPKEEKNMKIKDNTLCQLVEGQGGFGVIIDGKLFIDDTDKILATYIVRNKGKIKNKVKALTLDEWNSFKHYNLKQEKV